MASALLIDDNSNRSARIAAVLVDAGLSVIAEGSGPGGDPGARIRSLVAEHRPHLVAFPLDLAGDDDDAIAALCRGLRTGLPGDGTAILVVADGGRPDPTGPEADRIAAALEGGADEVLRVDEVSALAVSRVRRLVHARQLAALAILNEQLAQVGRLVAGIVHEIRAPLTVIRGNADLMALELGPDHAAGIWFRPIIRNARALQSRLDHLMAAVRVQSRTPQDLDVVPLLRESISLFEKGTDPSRGRVVIELIVAPPGGGGAARAGADARSPSIPAVRVDPGRLIQVVLNLLSNAHDAIVAERPSGRIEVRVRASPDDREVEIEVHDDGPGISARVVDRVFEPFFTTKEGGTGYGLYLAAEVLRENGGRLSVCNHDRGGACFSIHLPAAGSTPG